MGKTRTNELSQESNKIKHDEKIQSEKLAQLAKSNQAIVERKKHQAAESEPRCFVCHGNINISISPPCMCSGSGAGAGSESTLDSSGGSVPSSSTSQTQAESATGTKSEAIHDITKVIAFTQKASANDLAFNPMVISQLLFDRKLFFNNDRENGTLTIGLRYPITHDERNELRKLVLAVTVQLLRDPHLSEEKRNELILSIANFLKALHAGKSDITLSITVPKYAQYNNFIKRLAENYLLPIQNIEQKDNKKVEYKEKNKNFFNPFATELTYTSSGSKDKKDKDKDNDYQYAKALSTRMKSPLDTKR
jgi:hypothetical protein